MKISYYFILLLLLGSIALVSCEKDDLDFCPAVYYTVEGLENSYQNGDTLSGRVVVIADSLISGMNVKKIDCRLGNIVIGTVENELVCPFWVKLVDKPIGTHTFSVIIKCEAPGYDETYWRYDFECINIE